MQTRSPKQQLQDAVKGKWYAPIPLEQMKLGGNVRVDIKEILNEVLAKRKGKENG